VPYKSLYKYSFHYCLIIHLSKVPKVCEATIFNLKEEDKLTKGFVFVFLYLIQMTVEIMNGFSNIE